MLKNFMCSFLMTGLISVNVAQAEQNVSSVTQDLCQVIKKCIADDFRQSGSSAGFCYSQPNGVKLSKSLQKAIEEAQSKGLQIPELKCDGSDDAVTEAANSELQSIVKAQGDWKATSWPNDVPESKVDESSNKWIPTLELPVNPFPGR